MFATFATVTDSSFVSNTAQFSGGGLLAFSSVTVTGSSFVSNTAKADGGGLFALSSAMVGSSSFVSNTAKGNGGGLFSLIATVTSSTFVSNTAQSDGGGLYAFSATVGGSSLVSNTAQLNGGGLFSAIATVTSSSFVSNTAKASGGGLYSSNTAMVTSSTFVSNTASIQGGAVRASTLLTIENSTLVANNAPLASAVFNGSGSLPTLIAFSTLSAHNPASGTISTAGPLTLSNSIVAQNSGIVCVGAGAKLLAGKNFLPDATCGIGNDPLNPLLGPLADNGGPTLTQALLTGSPAINTANSCPASGVDQRGVPRGAPCDVGAYEVGGKPVLTLLVPPSTMQGSGGVLPRWRGVASSGTVALWQGSVRLDDGAEQHALGGGGECG
ncbi:MAG: choice-of-anchor Q domain-containing protein [Dehalococcoidia bacterium]